MKHTNFKEWIFGNVIMYFQKGLDQYLSCKKYFHFTINDDMTSVRCQKVSGSSKIKLFFFLNNYFKNRW